MLLYFDPLSPSDSRNNNIGTQVDLSACATQTYVGTQISNLVTGTGLTSLLSTYQPLLTSSTDTTSRNITLTNGSHSVAFDGTDGLRYNYTNALGPSSITASSAGISLTSFNNSVRLNMLGTTINGSLYTAAISSAKLTIANTDNAEPLLLLKM